MRSGYEVIGNALFMVCKLHPTRRNVFLSLEDIEDIVEDNQAITKIRIGNQIGSNTYYECKLDDLRAFIESSENLELTMHKGRNGFFIPVEDSPFVRVTVKSSDGDRWLAQRAKIIQEGGGPWTEEQRLAWKDKFAYKPPAKTDVH